MNHWLRKSLIVTCFTPALSSAQMGTGPQFTEPAPTVYLHSKEMGLPQFQLEKLKQDAPINQAIFDARGNVWFAGRTSAWKWTVGEASLQRVLLTSPSEPLVALQKSNGYLFVASDKHIFRVRFGPNEVIKFRHPAKKDGKSGRIVAGAQSVWWIHEDGIAWIGDDQKIQSLPPLEDDYTRLQQAWFDTDNRLFWYLQGQSLIKVDYRHRPPRREVVHHARHQFADIQGDDHFVMVHTNHTIIRFDEDHSIKQIIPVDGTRKLIASDISPHVHTYFFSDKLLEIYDLHKNMRYQSRLAVSGETSIDDIVTNGPYTIIIADGMPHLFSHERNVNLSQSKLTKAQKG